MNIGLGSIWIGIGNAIFGCLLAWMLLAKRTRTMTYFKIKNYALVSRAI